MNHLFDWHDLSVTVSVCVSHPLLKESERETGQLSTGAAAVCLLLLLPTNYLGTLECLSLFFSACNGFFLWPTVALAHTFDHC